MEAYPFRQGLEADLEEVAGRLAGAASAHDRRLDERVFLSTLPARQRERRLAGATVLLSLLAFAAIAPFATAQLPKVDAFIPAYQAALALSDLITAVLLFGQFSILRSPGLRLLASGYLFTALMVVVHMLSFPGLFAPTGLLGAGPQTTAWLYMFWHGGFPVLVLGYARLRKVDPANAGFPSATGTAILASIAGVVAAVIALTLLATTGQALLPAIMDGSHYTPLLIFVVSTVWLLSLGALVALWRRRPHSVLDLWLMVVMCAWLLDVALSAVFNAGRFDLGFYAGRIYGLMAASFVLLVLLLETRALYARLAKSLKAERFALEQRVIERTAQLETANRQLQAEIDDRWRAQLQLRVSETRHREVIELIREAIWIHSEGRVVFANPQAAEMFGLERPEDLVGRAALELVHPEDRENAAARTHVLVDNHKAVPLTEMRFVRCDGRAVSAEVHAIPFRHQGKPAVLAVARDVTHRRETEEQLRQAQKMESVGQLTGGVAHDFNNLLTVIIGNLDMTIGRLPSEVRPPLEGALKAAERGAALVRQMLAFSRRQTLIAETIDLNQVAASVEDLLKRTLGEHVEVEMKLARGLWPSLADKGQVENALLNLAINARDAMPDGGKLVIETGNGQLDEDYAARNAEVTPGEYVVLAVTDTGTGMPPDVIEHAFEPFFTTKEVGKGTGLGLSMIYGFAKQSGGHLKIYSEVGHGTTLRLYLPRLSAEAASAATAPPVLVDHPRGGETILVVEDDADVRKFVISQLRDLGYRVLETEDGPSAQKILDEDQSIDLLFTDVVMPGGMTGRQLAESAKARRPNLKTLYSSGYTENSIVQQGKLDLGVHFLAKPFRRQELAAKVREALDG